MKKVLLTLSAVALLAVVFSSCKKECYCTAKMGSTVIYSDMLVGEMTSSECAAFDNPTWTSMGLTFECEAR